MGTRSTIAIENADGTVHQIYCHWDGYLSFVGKILFENYSDRSKLEELIALGNISSLGSEIGVKHPFSPHSVKPGEVYDEELFKNMTTAYGRDRGETDVEPEFFDDIEDYEENHSYQEFEYIFTRDDVWSVFYNGEWHDLELELQQEGIIKTEEEAA